MSLFPGPHSTHWPGHRSQTMELPPAPRMSPDSLQGPRFAPLLSMVHHAAVPATSTTAVAAPFAAGISAWAAVLTLWKGPGQEGLLVLSHEYSPSGSFLHSLPQTRCSSRHSAGSTRPSTDHLPGTKEAQCTGWAPGHTSQTKATTSLKHHGPRSASQPTSPECLTLSLSLRGSSN